MQIAKKHNAATNSPNSGLESEYVDHDWTISHDNSLRWIKVTYPFSDSITLQFPMS